jgi:hypothetical protein
MTITHSPAHPSQKTCVSVWEDEGGATLHGRTSLTSTTEEGPELAALGAAVVARWNDLSRDVRKALFAAAVAGRQTSGRLARYLRAHRHDGD